MQSLTVAAIVAWAFVLATWTLMPAAWRRALWQAAARRVPALARRRAPKGGCGDCGGCDAKPAPAAAGRPGRVIPIRRQG